MATSSEPLVCCLCLTADRQELTAKAVECFEAQTYRNKWMLILDSGIERFHMAREFGRAVTLARFAEGHGQTIGKLRNAGCELANHAEVIVHWDSDDYSHPNRIAEQVALLQASGADAVGYNEMLFWRGGQAIDDGMGLPDSVGSDPDADAWLYSNHRPNYVLGTSLAYWRKTWERERFTDGPKPEATSEYHHWFKALKIEAESAVYGFEEPRMLARIHGGNHGNYAIEQNLAEGSKEWKRMEAWDARIQEILK